MNACFLINYLCLGQTLGFNCLALPSSGLRKDDREVESIQDVLQESQDVVIKGKRDMNSL